MVLTFKLFMPLKIVLERAGEQVAHEGNDLVVVAAGIALLNWRIVFVNDDDGLDAVMLAQHGREQRKRAGKRYFIRLIVDDRPESLLLHRIACRAVQQLAVTGILAADDGGDVLEGVLPRSVFHVLERQVDHGVFALEGAIVVATGPDGLVLEIDGGVLLAALKEHAQHVHVQRLAEAARTGEQRDLRQRVDEVADQQGLVDVVIPRDRLHIAGVPTGRGRVCGLSTALARTGDCA